MKSSGDFQVEKIYHNRLKLNFSVLFWTLLQREKGRKSRKGNGRVRKKTNFHFKIP